MAAANETVDDVSYPSSAAVMDADSIGCPPDITSWSGRLTDFDDDEEEDCRELTRRPNTGSTACQLFCCPCSILDGTIDPFNIFPHFNTKRFEVLKGGYIDTGILEVLSRHYMPVVFQSNQATASMLSLGAIYLDVQRNLQENSTTTCALIADAAASLNRQLASDMTVSDVNLLSIAHIMSAENTKGDEKSLIAHYQALNQAVVGKGGPGQALSEVLGHYGGYLSRNMALLSLLVSTAIEHQPHTMWLQYCPTFEDELACGLPDLPPPINPLFPPSELESEPHSTTLSTPIKQILQWVQHLTDVLLIDFGDFEIAPRTVCRAAQARNSSLAHSMTMRIRALPAIVAKQPHCIEPTETLYNCVRLVALVYTTAIARQIQLSVAARFIAKNLEFPDLFANLAMDLRSFSTEFVAQSPGVVFLLCLLSTIMSRRPTAERDGLATARRWTKHNDFARKTSSILALRAGAMTITHRIGGSTVVTRTVARVQTVLSVASRQDH